MAESVDNSTYRFINIHTHEARYEHNDTHIELLNLYPSEAHIKSKTYSIGIHPWHINETRLADELYTVREHSLNVSCLAIGECGLDKRIATPIEIQKPVFEQQLLIAEEVGKPVIIHCVAAFQELIEITKDLKITVPLVIHGFSKNKQLAAQLLDNGFFLSFGKYLLRNRGLMDTFITVPDDRYFLETDSVDESIEEVYKVAAEYKKTSVGDIQENVQRNFDRVFIKR